MDAQLRVNHEGRAALHMREVGADESIQGVKNLPSLSIWTEEHSFKSCCI